MTLYQGAIFGLALTPPRVLFACLLFLVTYIFLKIAKWSTSPLLRIRGVSLFEHQIFMAMSKDVCAFQLRNMKAGGEDGLYRFLGLDGSYQVGVYKPEFIKHILVTNSKNYKKPELFLKSFIFAKGGIFLANGPDHAWQRKLMIPIFSHASMKNYFGTFERHCADLIKLWSEKCKTTLSGQQVIDVQPDITRLTLDAISDAAFGYNFNLVLSGENKVGKALYIFFKERINPYRLVLSSIVPFFEYIPFKDNGKVKASMKMAEELIQEIIEQKMEAKAKGKTSVLDGDLLSLLINARDEDSGKSMSETTLRGNVWTFLVAGHETTSANLTWSLYYLAKNPRMQEKAREEALRVLDGEEAFNPDDVENLLYITAVIKETLRKASAISTVFREAIKDDWLGEFFIPKGTGIFIPVLGIHNFDEYWAEPEKFDPERFLGADKSTSAGVSGQTYLPFGSGPHGCIGSKFAMMEMKIVLAKLLATFRFSIDDNHPDVGHRLHVTLEPCPSPRLRVSLLRGKDA